MGKVILHALLTFFTGGLWLVLLVIWYIMKQTKKI